MSLLFQAPGFMRRSILEVVPHVYQLTVKGVNILLMVEDELTLVDTGFPGSSAQIVSFIRSLGRSVEELGLIIITHHHFDHVGGLAELKKLAQAKVAAHQADVVATEDSGTRRRWSRVSPFSVFSLRASEVDLSLGGGEVLKPLGGLRVIHTPGHTPGSISLFSASHKLLIVGDVVNTRYRTLRLPPKMVSTDLRQALDSIRRLAQLDFDILCGGHGQPLTEAARSKVLGLIESTKLTV